MSFATSRGREWSARLVRTWPCCSPRVTNTDAAAAPDPTCRLSGGEAVTASGVDVARLERCGDLRRGLSVGETETDYLVVGAGAPGMAFVDALVGERRRRRGGGGPAALAGRPLAGRLPVRAAAPAVGELRRELTGARPRPHRRDRAERRVLRARDRRGDLRLLPAGPRRDPRADRQGALPRDDRVPRRRHRGHRAPALLTGEETTVRVRRRLVD